MWAVARQATAAHRLRRLSGWQSGETGPQSRCCRFRAVPCCGVHRRRQPPLLAVAAVRLHAAAESCGALLRVAGGAQRLRCPPLLTAVQSEVGRQRRHVCMALVLPPPRAAAGCPHCQQLSSAAVAAGCHLAARHLQRAAAGATASSHSVWLPAAVPGRLADPAVLAPNRCLPQNVGHGLRKMERDCDRGPSSGRPGNVVWPDWRGRHTACWKTSRSC